MLHFTGKAAINGFLILCSVTLYAQAPRICNRPVQLLDATRQNWAPGIVQENSQSSGGMIYELSVRIRKKGNVTFDKLIVNNQMLDVEAVQDGQRHVAGPFRKGDRILLIARFDRSKSPEPADENILARLKNKDAEAALLYTIRNKQRLKPVQSFAEKRANALPQ